jgi:hypothetical protein
LGLHAGWPEAFDQSEDAGGDSAGVAEVNAVSASGNFCRPAPQPPLFLRPTLTSSKIELGALTWTFEIRKEATAMKTKDRKPTPTDQKTPRQSRAEKQTEKKFYAELQQAIDGVDWGKVKLPMWR